MKNLLIILFIFLTTSIFAQPAVGIFQNNKDIGNPKTGGSATYDAETQTYTINRSRL